MRQKIGREELGENITKNGEIRSIWKFFAGFCDHSTIHGVRYFAESRRHWTERSVNVNSKQIIDF